MNITNHKIRHKVFSKMFCLGLLVVMGLNACAAKNHEPLPTSTVVLTGQSLTSSAQAVSPVTQSASNGCSGPKSWMSQVSPDGQWMAKSAGDLGYLSIMSCNDKSTWDLSFQEIAGIDPCLSRFGETNCSEGILYIHHWDKDSRYVFVEVNYLMERLFDYSYGLYRLDVKTHQISPWLKAAQDVHYVYAFSPDNQRYAFQSSADGDTIHVNSIETGQISSYQIPHKSSGIAYLVWSPDNQKVAFTLLYEESFKIGGFSLAVLDLNKGKVIILVADYKEQLYPIRWSSETKIILTTPLTDYQYDLQTNELEEIP